MTNKKSNYTNHIGIDVGKLSLEVGFTDRGATSNYPNNKDGWRKLWQDNRKSFKGALVVVETTGWYELGVIHYLVGKGVAVHRASARQVKQFIASYGTLAKTDAIDARALAQYGKERAGHLAQYDIPDKTQEKLQILYARNLDLKKMLVQEKNRLQAPAYQAVAEGIMEVVNLLEKQVDNIMEKIMGIVEANPVLLKKWDTLQTIDGIGKITALALLASMPELGSLNRKQAASLAGLAPHPKDSGKKSGYRRTKGGRCNIKEIVHMAALGAIRKNHSKLKQFYVHLLENNHKKPMVALTAVKRKIIVIANARLAELQHLQNLAITVKS